MAQASAKQQLAQNRSQEDQTRSNYDFGMGTGGEANPFGQKQLLDRNQGIEGTDLKNQAASRPGGVRSGAYKVRQGNQVFGQAQQRDTLQRNFDNTNLGYTRQREDINNGFNTDIYNAGLGSVERALDRVVPDPGPAAADGGTVATPQNSSFLGKKFKPVSLGSIGKPSGAKGLKPTSKIVKSSPLKYKGKK